MNTERLLSFRLLSQAGFWLLFIGFIVRVSLMSFTWPEALYRILFITGCHVINFYACYSLIIPKFLLHRKYLLVVLSVLLLLVVLTPLRMLGESMFIVPWSIATHPGARLGLALLSEITIAAFASLLALAASHDEHQKQVDKLRAEKLEAELKFLKAQISPHFLFNIINNIYSLVLTHSKNAPEALLKLSGLLRYLLYDCSGKVSIAMEVDAIKTYASLFSLRSENEMDVRWNIDVSDEARLIEPMFLIPLVENVFKHSGLGVDKDAKATINISSNDNEIVMYTCNTIGRHAVDNGRSGIGMENIALRFNQMFPGNHEFTHGISEDRFVIKLKMPLS